MKHILLLLLLTILSATTASAQAERLIANDSSLTRVMALSLVAKMRRTDPLRLTDSTAVFNGGDLFGFPVFKIYLDFKEDTVTCLTITLKNVSGDDKAREIYKRIQAHLLTRLGEATIINVTGRTLAASTWIMANWWFEVSLTQLFKGHHEISVRGCPVVVYTSTMNAPRQDSWLR